MNPLKSVPGTIIAGFVLAIVILLATGDGPMTAIRVPAKRMRSSFGSMYLQESFGSACCTTSTLFRCLH